MNVKKTGHSLPLTLFSVGGVISLVVMSIISFYDLREKRELEAARSKVWNEVSYPQGNIGTVVPERVKPGALIEVTFKEYCNNGVDVNIERRLNFLRADGTVEGAIRLSDLFFFPTPEQAGCVKNLTQRVGLPTELQGRPPGDAIVQIKFINRYVKPEQVVEVKSFTETFILEEGVENNG